MKFGNFMFSESRDPARDSEVLDEIIDEAKLCDALGMDALWLAEHHFSGTCVFRRSCCHGGKPCDGDEADQNRICRGANVARASDPVCRADGADR